MPKASGPPCAVCGKRVASTRVTRCPWCGRVLCLDCKCPNRYWERGYFQDVPGGIKTVLPKDPGSHE
jgi:hypothetical protein